MRKVALTVVVAGAMLAGFAATSSAKTVWLCKPGQQPDPCTPGLSTTVYTPSFSQVRVEHPKAVSHPAIDCFYVYPTVSGQTTGNANLQIDPEEQSIALYQAARYSQYCSVYAPMYRQVTLDGIGLGKTTTPPNPALALADVEAAFHTYLTKYNHGRGFVLIGHSQGSFVLRELIAKDVDPKPAVRRRLVSAILMGGNVLVKRGSGIGGDFKHIPACKSARQIGCVIAFSTFDQPVPTPSLFGRPTSTLGTKALSGDVVLCTNPAALSGGSGLLDPIFPSAPFDPQNALAAGIALLGIKFPMPPTVWVGVPGAYRAECSSANDANVLEITPQGGAPTPNPSPTAEWGLHLIDANVALGNLIQIVRSEAVTFLSRGLHGGTFTGNFFPHG
jgi:pimeloyl-ACP methyl ester carboxylesterase